MQTKKAISLLLTLVLVFGIFAGTIPSASAAEAGATLSVDLDPAVNIGKAGSPHLPRDGELRL